MRKPGVILILLGLAVVVLVLSPMAGMKVISVRTLLSDTPGIDGRIFWSIRVPRVLVAFLAGAALACSGMCFQAMFRNPLATPFTLGVSSGASLGAAAYVWLGVEFGIAGLSGMGVFAFAGALMSILLVYSLTRAKRDFSTSTMLLAGVAISFFFSSLILFVQYLSDFNQSFMIIRWLMGGVETTGYRSLANLALFVLVGGGLIFLLRNELNLLMVGEDIAVSRGANVKAIKVLLFFSTSLMVGGVVSICGPIGFVGMMCPHICRLVVGPNHRTLMPATFLFGGIFLTSCDVLARVVIAPAEIPVGIITALLGGPFFIWLLLRGGLQKTG